MALDDTMDTQPTKAATPITSDQKPTSSSAQTTIPHRHGKLDPQPGAEQRNAPTRRTNRLLNMVIRNRKTMFSANNSSQSAEARRGLY